MLSSSCPRVETQLFENLASRHKRDSGEQGSSTKSFSGKVLNLLVFQQIDLDVNNAARVGDRYLLPGSGKVAINDRRGGAGTYNKTARLGGAGASHCTSNVF
jgi:hypothetical protein